VWHRLRRVLTGERRITKDDVVRLRKRYLRRIPRHWLRRLPSGIAVPILTELGWPRADTCDEREIEVPDPFRLEAYWLRVGDDEGPAASLFYGVDEILRIDCLRANPHLHYGLAESRHRAPAEARTYFPPASMEEQIDRAVFELGRNVAYCTGLHRSWRVRTAPVDEVAFQQAAEVVGEHLRDLVATHRG
jgi:hypothetical protein